MSGLSTSRSQELAIDIAERGRDVPIERLSTPALVAERQRLQAVLDSAPTIPPGADAHDVEYTERNLRMTESRIEELSERKRPLRERLRGADIATERAVALRDQLQEDLAGHRSRQQARDDGFVERKRYLADHDGDRQKIERIDDLLGARALNAVADAMIDTPEYPPEPARRLPLSATQGPLDRGRDQGRELPPSARDCCPCLRLRSRATGYGAACLAARSR